MKIMLLVPPSKGGVNIIRDLVYGCWCKGKRIGGTELPPLSLIQLATVLKQDSFDTRIIDADAFGIKMDDLGKEIINYDVVVLLSSSISIEEDSKVLQGLKKINPNLKTVIFGDYSTVNPEQALSHEGIDIAVRHEPEYIIRDLIRSFDSNNGNWRNIEGIAFLRNNRYVHNPNYPWIENLDELPFPDRTMIPKDVIYFNPVVKAMPYTTMVTSRGCISECTFCSSPAFYGGRIRYRSSDSVMEELRIIKNLGYKEVFFRDEVFTFSRKRTRDVCIKIIKKRLNMKWICSTRADLLDYPTMKLMKEAGCHMIRIGVESGVQTLLNNIRKDITLGQIRKAFECANALKIDTHAHLIIGIPGENNATIRTTMKFVKEINPTIVTYGILIPYPGTPLFQYVLDKRPEAKAEIEKGNSCTILCNYLTNFSADKLLSYVRKCYMDFYLRPKYILKWFMKCNSLDEFKRALLAGCRLMEFILGRE